MSVGRSVRYLFVIITLFFIFTKAAPALASPITIEFDAMVSLVDDPSNILEDRINVFDVITSDWQSYGLDLTGNASVDPYFRDSFLVRSHATDVRLAAASVPEPSAFLLIGSGLAGFAF